MTTPTTLHVITTFINASENSRQVLVIRNKQDAFALHMSGDKTHHLKLATELAKKGWIQGIPFAATESGFAMTAPLADFLAEQNVTLIDCDEEPEAKAEIMALFDSIKAKNAR